MDLPEMNKQPTTFSLTLLLAFMFLVVYTHGQTVNRPSGDFGDNWQINYQLGLTQFYGDASSNDFLTKLSGETALSNGLTIRKYFTPVYGLGLNIYYTGLKSHKEKSSTGSPLDYLLTGSCFDVNLQSYVDFTNLLWGYEPTRKLSIYGLLGIGYASWDTQLEDVMGGAIRLSGSTVNDITYKKGGIVIPVGFGLNYRFNDRLAINVGGNFRTILNDDVDVWRGGFEYDQLFNFSAGISYYINPLFGATNKQKRKPKEKEISKKPSSSKRSSRKPVDFIPLYDYKKNNSSTAGGSGVKKNVEVMQIDQPISPATVPIKGVEYRVQIMAKRDRLPSVNILRNKYGISGDIIENFQDGVYRYSTGSFSAYQDALAYSRQLKAKGVSDAFVVVYKNNQRIPLTNDLK